MTRLKLAILISGRGSNMEAILEAARDPAYPAQPVLVLSNRPEGAGNGYRRRHCDRRHRSQDLWQGPRSL